MSRPSLTSTAMVHAFTYRWQSQGQCASACLKVLVEATWKCTATSPHAAVLPCCTMASTACKARSTTCQDAPSWMQNPHRHMHVHSSSSCPHSLCCCAIHNQYYCVCWLLTGSLHCEAR